MVDFTGGSWRSLIDGSEVNTTPDSVAYRWVTPIGGLSDTDAVDPWPADVGGADMDGFGLTYAADSLGNQDAVSGDGSNDYGDPGTLGTFGSELARSAIDIAFKTSTTADESVVWGVLNDGESTSISITLNQDENQNAVTGETAIDIRDEDGERRAVSISEDIYDGTPHTIRFDLDTAVPNIDVYVDGSEVPTTVGDNTGTPDNFGDFEYGATFFGRNVRGSIDRFADIDISEIRLHDQAPGDTAQEFHESQPWATVTDGGVNIQEQSTSQLTSKSGWQGRPVMAELSNGDWAMVYRDGSTHSYDQDAEIHIRFSDDNGDTWTADNTTLGGSSVTGFPYSPTNDPSNNIILEAPNGDLLIHTFANGDTTRHGTRQLRSTDGGASWTDEGVVSWENYGGQDEELCSGQDYFIHPTTDDIYVGLFIDDQLDKSKPLESGIAKSTDNGSTWDFLSVISSGTNEVGIEYTGGDGIVAILRDDDGSTTYRSVSDDLGSTWSVLEDVGSAFNGAMNKPILHFDGKLQGASYTDGPLWMVGRDRATTEYVTLAWSTDTGQSWDVHYFDSDDDAGYADMLHRAGDEYYFSSYKGTTTSADVFDWVFTK